MSGKLRKMYAWCNEDGLITFSAKVPANGYPLCQGTKHDMEIVRRVSFKVDNRFYVPGDMTTEDRELVFETFAETCCERADTPIPFSERRKVPEFTSYDQWMREVVGFRGST